MPIAHLAGGDHPEIHRQYHYQPSLLYSSSQYQNIFLEEETVLMIRGQVLYQTPSQGSDFAESCTFEALEGLAVNCSAERFVAEQCNVTEIVQNNS